VQYALVCGVVPSIPLCSHRRSVVVVRRAPLPVRVCVARWPQFASRARSPSAAMGCASSTENEVEHHQPASTPAAQTAGNQRRAQRRSHTHEAR
jgi:hypothetical protein